MKTTSKKAFFLLSCLFGLGLLLGAAFVVADESDGQKAEAALTPADIPSEAAAVKNPLAGDAVSASRGKQIFASQCTMCHGADGAGTGDLVPRLELDIPDFTNTTWHGEWSDGALFYVLSKGHGAMPGQAKRFDEELRWDLVNYVRTFKADG